ncbi:MAG: cupredoxin domain-containing protein [Nanoarchaeota archaeon]
METIRCCKCDREFKTKESLAMHNSAKHDASSKTRMFGMDKMAVFSVSGILLAVVIGFFIYGAGFTGDAVVDKAIPSSGPGAGSIGDGPIGSVIGDSPQKVRIGFNGNYYPNTIRVKSGRLVEITLDNSVGGCFRSFNIDAFGVSGYSSSPSDTISFIPDRKGTFEYRCGMGMGRGTIIVE